ncbi:MAG: ferrous iron transporter B, partial [Cellulomonadaceae bacterium]|nr:ferrous iron transporter B [Cellulomonadaceae bacterium]
MSCHEPVAGSRSTTGAPTTNPVVILAGNPNSGKSTLFNMLTGARQTVMNAPGTTVEMTAGRWRHGHHDITLVDLPGTYSLVARSPDEKVAADAITGTTPAGQAAVAVVVLDASVLGRSLYLLSQVIASDLPVVVACTMIDVAAARSVEPDLDALAQAAAVPVVAVDPRTGSGIEMLAAVVDRVIHDSAESVAKVPQPGLKTTTVADVVANAEEHFAWTEQVLAAAVPTPPATPVRSFSDRVDAVLLHPVLGIPVFLAVMWAVFQLTANLATPLIDFFARLVTDTFGGWLSTIIGVGWLRGLVVDGILAGVGTVVSFVPLIALIFLAIGILEDSGYLARAAFVADRGLRAIGLDGRAMMPLVIGFGCNIPAITATRTMPDARRRLLTGLLIPLASCPARLTVYVLVAGAFFPDHVGTVVFALYLLSGLLIVAGGLALKSTAF